MTALLRGMAAFWVPVALWQLLVTLLSPPRYVLPAPADVLAATWRQKQYLFDNTLVTLSEIAAGFAAGASIGIAVAFGLAALPRLGALVWPLVLVVQALPVFVAAPVLVLWFGFGMASKVVMTMLIIFFPVASAFADGLRRTERELVEAAILENASHWRILTAIRLPLAMPALISGLRVAAPLAPLGAVIGEWVGASAGLGFVMIQANARMQTDTVFAAMAILACLALALRAAVDRLAPRLAPWAQER